MNLMVSGVLGAVLVTSGAGITMQPSESESVSVYAAARPYLDLSLPELKSNLRGLEGLKVSDDPSKLKEILRRTGEAVMEQVPRVPNLTARELIAPERVSTAPNVVSSGSKGTTFVMDRLSQDPQIVPDWKLYEYFIRVDHKKEGQAFFDESRTKIDKKGALAPPQGVGFGQQWLMFSSARQDESRFRYLGEQKVNGHSTYAIAFAQQPAKVAVPGELKIDGQNLPLLFQGVAWVDQTSYRIVKIRTDLLAPIARIKLDAVTTTTSFADTRIPGLKTTLVMPKEVEIVWKRDGNQVGEMHRYLNYRLYHATARILPD